MSTLERLFFMGWLLVMAILFPGIVAKGGFIPLLLAAALATVIYYVWYSSFFDVNHWSRVRYLCITALIAAVMLFMMFSAGRLLLSEPFNDAGTIYYSTVEVVESGKISTEINDYI